MQNPKVRGVLVAAGLLSTIALAPISFFGAYLLLMSLLSDAPDRFQSLGWSFAGIGGLVGIAGAWVRVVVPGKRFQSSAPLKWGTAAALVVGISIAGLTLVSAAARDPLTPVTGVLAIILAIGVFLLGATVGEVRSNSALNTDAEHAPRAG